MQAIRVRDNLVGLELKSDGNLRLSYAVEEASPRPQPTGNQTVDAWIEFESGEVGLSESTDRTGGATEILAWLRSEVDGDLLDRFYDEWLRAKAWKRRDQPDWEALRSIEPSEMVYWQEAFPDERPDVFLLRDGAFMVWDAHCINPHCTFTDSRLMILDTVNHESHEVGSVLVDHVRGVAKDFEAFTISKSAMRRVWRAYSRRHQVAKRLRIRKQRLTELVRQVDLPSAPPLASLQNRTVVKIGRNQPCPCGSGKKYKRCCGRPGR